MVKVVMHPLMPQGVADELEGMADIELSTPKDSDGVAAALNDGGEILVTFLWQDRFFTPSLRWVASVSAGSDQFPLDRLRAAGVAVTSARGVNAIPVAEHAMALLLGCTRRIGQATRAAVDHEWVQRPSRLELFGSTVVVLGLGAIGEEVAKRAEAFGMRVIGIKRDPSTHSGAVEDVRGTEALLDACREAQVLISTLPGGEATHHLVGDEVFDALGRGVVVNVGRGSVVDEQALGRALEERRLHAAGLDVYGTEPLPDDSPLWDIPTLVLTPHIGGSGPKYGLRWIELFGRNMAAFRDGGDWVNRIAGGTGSPRAGHQWTTLEEAPRRRLLDGHVRSRHPHGTRAPRGRSGSVSGGSGSHGPLPR